MKDNIKKYLKKEYELISYILEKDKSTLLTVYDLITGRVIDINLGNEEDIKKYCYSKEDKCES